jgi:hypothetical protein
MEPRPAPYTIAACAMAASAGLHMVATAAAGFAPSTLFMLAIAAFYLLIGFGLLRALRWVAYLTFVCVLIGANGALIELGLGRFADVWMVAIAVADAVAAVALFAALWRSAPTSVNAR